jgi:hypothetical protein
MEADKFSPIAKVAQVIAGPPDVRAFILSMTLRASHLPLKQLASLPS